MKQPIHNDVDFWRGALLAGGLTSIPRWTLDPVPGIGTHEAAIPDDLVARLQRLSEDLALPLTSVLLTAHAKVLAALSGEQEVATGYVADEGAEPLLCRLTHRARLLAGPVGERPSRRIRNPVAPGLPGRCPRT